VIVRVSLATELPRLLAALRSNRVGNLAVDVVVLDGSLRRVGEGPNGVDPSSPAVRGMSHQFTLTARDSVPGVKR
jgi:hypothetical protein